MKRLTRKKPAKDEESSKQTRISSFFSRPPILSTKGGSSASSKPALPDDNVFKTPEVKKPLERNDGGDDDLIENSPEVNVERKRKLFRLKKLSSKSGVGLGNGSTASLISGNIFGRKRVEDVEAAFPKKRKSGEHPAGSESEPKVARIEPESASQCISSTPNDDEDNRFTTIRTSPSGGPTSTPIIMGDLSFLIDDDSPPKEKSPVEKTGPKKNLLERLSELALCSKYGRHMVTSVTADMGSIVLELRDAMADKGSSKPKICTVRGSWAETRVESGDIVNVLNVEWDADGCCTVDDVKGLLIVNPDQMMSGTSIVSTLFCMRKAVLNEKYKGIEGPSRTMLIGTLVHELLQECLRDNVRCENGVESQLSACLRKPSILQDLLTLGMTTDDMKKEVEPFMPHIIFFIDKYVAGKHVNPPAAAYANTGGGSSQRSFGGRPPPPPQIWPGKVEAIMDIEENIWSPRLGIKGKVDLTVQVKLPSKDKQGRLSKTLPLELKTGRPSGSAEHRGQVIMYSMMMSERRPDPEAGLLLYLRTSSMQEVRAGLHEMRGLVQLRNQLVSYMQVGRTDLPEPINAKRACRECTHLTVCTALQRLNSAVPELPTHAMAELVPATLAHLGEPDLEFFNRWSVMCALETGEAKKASRLKLLWCQTPAQRENQGRAVAGLRIVSAADDNRVTFSKTDGCEAISQSTFQPGEMVIVSTDNELALAQGYVVLCDEAGNTIELALDKSLAKSDRRRTYVIDKYEFSGSNGAGLINLARLMMDNARAGVLRDTVVKREAVTFLPGLPKETATRAKHILRPLNRVQQKAVFKVLMAERYVLLKGMPGSGKTTLIVALLRVLAAMGKSVLLTAYTHAAVDNVLLKLADHGRETFLRLGKASRIHKSLVDRTAEKLTSMASSTEKLDEVFRSVPIVATTCLGTNHPAVTGRNFDYCVVDEAGQSTLLSALGPLFHADKFVLVGDPQQLPPVVVSRKAKTMGMDASLFSHLQTSDNVLPLTLQYRMNSHIQALANYMTYDGQLECGSDAVACRNVDIPASAVRGVPAWVAAACTARVSFVDTVGTTAEATDDAGVSNPGEAQMVAKLARAIMGHASLGIIAPYRAQVATLKKLVVGHVSAADVSTVDQFQGRDKDVIIYSCTRTRPKPEASCSDDTDAVHDDIMSDYRRLNVAVTRAKSKLVVVGCAKALSTYAPFKKMIGYMTEQGHLVKIDES